MRTVVRTTALVALAAVLVVLCGRLAAMRGLDTDLFPRWYGLRQLLLHGRDPYGDAVTREIAARTWFLAAASPGGAAADVSRTALTARAPANALSANEVAYGFLYPLPGALLLAPLALLPYQTALTAWTAAGVLLLAATGWLVADAALATFALPPPSARDGRALTPRPPLPGTGEGGRVRGNGNGFSTAIAGLPSPLGGRGAGGEGRVLLAPAMALFFLPGWVNLVLGQPATLVTFLIALALWLETRRRDIRAGFGAGAALAAATLLKPHLLLVVAPLWLARRAAAWRSGDRHARAFVLGAAGAALCLAGAAALLLPAWPAEWLAAARAYAAVAPGAPVALLAAAAALPRWPAAATATAAGAALLSGVVRARRGPAVDLVSRAAVATALLVPPAWITNAVLLLIPLAATCAWLRPRHAALFAAASAALSLAALPVFLGNDPRSGTLVVLAYSALLAGARWRPVRLRSAAAAAAAALSAPR